MVSAAIFRAHIISETPLGDYFHIEHTHHLAVCMTAGVYLDNLCF